MLRVLLFALATGLAVEAHASNLRQYHAESVTPLDEVVTALERRLPKMVHSLGTGFVTVAYSGKRPPLALTRFLEAWFEELPPKTFGSGRTLSLSLTVHGDDNGTILSLMLLGDFPGSGVKLPPKSVMMMDGGSRADCTGQYVARHPADAEETAKIYRKHMEVDGFSFSDNDPQEASYFIGQAPGCTLAMYLQPDQNTTMVVIRYLEE